MADQVHVQLVGVLGIGDPKHLVVGLLEGRPLREEAEASTDAVDVRIHGNLGAPEREDHHARRRLAPDARQRRQERDRLVARCVRKPVEVRMLAELAQDGLDPRALGVGQPPGRRASMSSSRGASRTSSQLGKRSRRRAYATSRLASEVFWERTVRTSSAIGCPWGWFTGRR